MEKIHRFAYIASLIAGTLILLPAFGMASMVARPDLPAAQKTAQVVGAVVLMAIAAIPIFAFFLRRAKAGPRLLKTGACLLIAIGLFLPFSLAMPAGIPVVILALALTGTAILSLTVKLHRDIQ
ncbi:MAG: hypothetical protein JNM27_20075 [Leptospirales bacterium]|nr:hypothetical protein [Leptospirales bacterium]